MMSAICFESVYRKIPMTRSTLFAEKNNIQQSVKAWGILVKGTQEVVCAVLKQSYKSKRILTSLKKSKTYTYIYNLTIIKRHRKPIHFFGQNILTIWISEVSIYFMLYNTEEKQVREFRVLVFLPNSYGNQGKFT